MAPARGRTAAAPVTDARAVPAPAPAISLRGLRKEFAGGVVAVHDLDLDVAEGGRTDTKCVAYDDWSGRGASCAAADSSIKLRPGAWATPPPAPGRTPFLDGTLEGGTVTVTSARRVQAVLHRRPRPSRCSRGS